MCPAPGAFPGQKNGCQKPGKMAWAGQCSWGMLGARSSSIEWPLSKCPHEFASDRPSCPQVIDVVHWSCTSTSYIWLIVMIFICNIRGHDILIHVIYLYSLWPLEAFLDRKHNCNWIWKQLERFWAGHEEAQQGHEEHHQNQESGSRVGKA